MKGQALRKTRWSFLFTSEDYKTERLGHCGQLGSCFVAKTEIVFAGNCYPSSQLNLNSVTTWFIEGPVLPSEIGLPITSGWIWLPLRERTCLYSSTSVTGRFSRTGLICVLDTKGTEFPGPIEKRQHRNASCFLATGIQDGVLSAMQCGDIPNNTLI